MLIIGRGLSEKQKKKNRKHPVVKMSDVQSGDYRVHKEMTGLKLEPAEAKANRKHSQI